ncbi:MAG: zinc ribbon domain-containing protein, partial [Clostridia bacterium]|nr:zinc ribbon domain-containing protein [Clostridia bacterium]
MICKECGAYNPDHATFCKVCAASLKPDAAPNAPEQEQQPTKRFSRPSWIVPEQSEPEEKIVEKPAVNEEIEETVEEPVAPVEKEKPAKKELPEQEEETPAPMWTPTRSRRKPEPMILEEDDEEEAEDPAESEEEPESIYNEEEALEEEEDPFEYEPTPPKRKQQKKKKNTMFTVLLIAIIVVIVGILVLGGYLLLKNQLNCGNSAPRNNPDAQQTGTQTEDQTVPSDPATTEAPALDSKTAQLQELVDQNNDDLVVITVVVPANSTLVIDFPYQDDYTFQNTESKEMIRKVKIPVAVFYSNQLLEESTVVFQPDITINQADGTSYKVNCPTFTRTFPKLN